MNFIVIFISTLIMTFSEIICCHRVLNEKIDFKSFKIYLIYFISVVLIFLNYVLAANIYKVLVSFIIMMLMFFLLFKVKFKDCFIGTVILEVMTIISELLFAVIISLFHGLDANSLAQSYQGTLFTNVMISTILIMVSILINPHLIFKKLSKLVSNITINKIILFFSFVILCSSFLFYISYYNKNETFTLIVNFAITTIYFVIVVMIIVKEHNYNVVKAKYKTTLNELEEYESIINEYRVINHENQNQLNSIKGMTSNKRVREYIDEILNNKNKKNELILKQALLIPTGGLRGLIYSKLVIMKNKNINYNLHIDKKINIKLTKNISTKTMLNVCQIIGVYLDNAIEAVENLKQKNILISIYKVDNIVIEIINNKENYVDINKVDKAGYTTQEGIHGYGLSLVSKILKEDPKLINEREITQNTFKQKLIIKQ